VNVISIHVILQNLQTPPRQPTNNNCSSHRSDIDSMANMNDFYSIATFPSSLRPFAVVQAPAASSRAMPSSAGQPSAHESQFDDDDVE